jgi:hypothetical protein
VPRTSVFTPNPAEAHCTFTLQIVAILQTYLILHFAETRDSKAPSSIWFSSNDNAGSSMQLVAEGCTKNKGTGSKSFILFCFVLILLLACQ